MSEYKPIRANEFIVAICEALNIESNYIIDMTISLIPGAMAEIEVNRYCDDRLLPAIVKLAEGENNE